MKRYAVIITALFGTLASLGAQGLMDATKYSKTDIMGTARYMSMAGSMGALGGDPSAVIDNPAGLGIYRSSELSFTLNATPSVTQSLTADREQRANDFFFNFNQLSYVLSVASGREHGYVSSNFSFTYNRVKDYYRTVAVGANGVPSMANMMADLTNGLYASSLTEDNPDVPYLSILGYEGYMIDPVDYDSLQYSPVSETASRMAYKGVESGHVDEYNFSYAANIGHVFYFGAGIGIRTLSYRLSSYNGEVYANGVDNATLHNVFSTSGVGTVLRVGVIARPVSFMRLGLSFQSPVWYSMSDRFYGEIDSYMGSRSSLHYATGAGSSKYDFNAPLKVQASLAFVIGKSALINADYVYTHNTGMSLNDDVSKNSLFSEPAFAFENDEISRMAKNSHMVKVGAEFRIASSFSLRAGAAYETQNISDYAARNLMDNTIRTDVEYFKDKGSFYAAGGFGYRYNGFGIDLTYAYSQHNQSFSPYQQGAQLITENGRQTGYFGIDNSQVPLRQLADVKTMRHNVVLTLLYKF